MAYTDTKKKTILDTKVLQLYGKNDQGKAASWTVDIWNNQVQITVWTNVPGDINSGRISALMTVLEFNEMLELIDMLASQNDQTPPAPVVYKATNRRPAPRKGGYNKGGNNGSNEPKVVSRVYVGRNPEGYIFVCAEEPNRPRVSFPFVESTFKEIRDNAGNSIPAHLLSNLLARAYTKTCRHLISNVAHDVYTEPQARPKGGYNNNRGNGGGGYNNNNNNNSADFGAQETDTSGDNAFGF